MTLHLLAIGLLLWFAYAIGYWRAENHCVARMRRTLTVIGRDKPVKLARAVAQPAIVRREPWEAWRS